MKFFKHGVALVAMGLLVACSVPAPETGVSTKFESIRDNDIQLRVFLQDMPKGGDLHNHLYGAVYPESWIRWAEEDGLCIDPEALAIRHPGADGCGGLQTAKAALANNQVLRNALIDRFSIRDFVPTSGWSGHDQFFRTFPLVTAQPHRFGDMVAETANLAGIQNVQYLELLHTMELFETILPMVIAIPMSGDVAADYETLMASPFGAALPEILARARRDIDAADARKDELLGCKTDAPQPGCAVEIRYLHQPVRTLPASVVYAHTIFGWHLMAEDDRFVGTNLVAPEDDFIALRDYKLHMAQIDHLYKTLGERNVSLHAGELWLGLVHPQELRFHINDAIKVGHAKRIGHGTDIVFETDYKNLLKYMAENEIMVEVNLTSSEAILGVSGSEHPYDVYKQAGVPMAFSTDDEGVGRIDLTHEYMRAVQEHGLSYVELKTASYNGLKYAFVDEVTKAELIKKLDTKFADFESKF
ncbi:MAG: adenosine deaminase [Robiginitomaculum sp.]|nr:MAG: adenosine deaminase [Robiginitomaculum sp.]